MNADLQTFRVLGEFPVLRASKCQISQDITENISITIPLLSPVLHQPDLPLAGYLFSMLWWGALHGALGCSHHNTLSQARVGWAQLVGGDISCGSCEFITANHKCFCLTFSLTKNTINMYILHQRMLRANTVTSANSLSTILPSLKDEFPLTVTVTLEKFFFWFQFPQWTSKCWTDRFLQSKQSGLKPLLHYFTFSF